MSKYYYLVAQLPYLQISPADVDSLSISYANFYELASRFLTPRDMKVLEKLSLEPDKSEGKTDSRFLNAWYEWERLLRVALAQLRATNMKKEFDSQGFSIPAPIQQIARTACNCDSPLEAEKLLNAERLRVLNELTPLDGFCSDAVFAYGLKLQMAERISLFNKEAGMSSYRTIYNQILGDAK